MVRKPDKKILDYKKQIFLNEVGKSVTALRAPIPKVNFWSHYEDHFPDGERAHIHIDTNTICIAEIELEMMSEEDIKITASHEVSHLHHEGHGLDFQRTHEEVQIGSWEHPTGTIGALPEDYVSPKEEKIKSRVIKCKCNKCDKRTKTKKCKHCGEYFCEKHVKPKEPYVGINFNETDESNNYHPCFGYSSYLDKKKKKEDEKYIQTLDRLCKKNGKKDNWQKDIYLESLERLKENNRKEKLKKKKKRKEFFKKIFKYFKKE